MIKCLPLSVIGERLQLLREQCNFSIEQLADFLEIDQQEYTEIEQGIKPLNTVQLEKLCYLYLINEDDLIYKKDYKPVCRHRWNYDRQG